MKLLPSLHVNPDSSQLIYAIFVIVLIPVLLASNTLYLLHNMQRDMDYELNNKALLVESVTALQISDRIDDPTKLQSQLQALVTRLPEIRAIEIFRLNQEYLSAVVTTSSQTKTVSDPVLNQLAWGSNQAYSKQIIARVGSSQPERIWLVASPIQDLQNKKVGLINIYISAKQIDDISSRTTRDSLFILVGLMVVVMLVLLNHFRFFEISILFKKLSEIDKLKDDFISMASHELRTPLTAISSYAFLLLKNKNILADEKVKKQLSVILNSSERLKILVNDILDVSRIEQKRVKLVMQVQDIGPIIESVVNELLPQAQEKKLLLVYYKQTTPLRILGDKDKIHQVFVNLIGNAIKYTQTGEIKVFHQIVGNEVRTFVKDTGIGMSTEDREQLFNKFYRIHTNQTEDIPGTGLGLWITKQLILAMNGKISVESIVNTGSQFTVTFLLRNAREIQTPQGINQT